MLLFFFVSAREYGSGEGWDVAFSVLQVTAPCEVNIMKYLASNAVISKPNEHNEKSKKILKF